MYVIVCYTRSSKLVMLALNDPRVPLRGAGVCRVSLAKSLHIWPPPELDVNGLAQRHENENTA